MYAQRICFLPFAAFLLLTLLAAGGGISFAALSTFGLVAIVLLLMFQFRLDYRHPAVVFAAPWVIVLLFASVELSEFARPISLLTGYMLLSGVLLAFTVAGLRIGPAVVPAPLPVSSIIITGQLQTIVLVAFGLFVTLSGVQVALSGYVPLLRGLMTGYSYYLTWGISGLTGFYFAFGNATATVAFIGWILTGRRTYLLISFAIVLCYVMVVSRYNVICILVQCFAAYIILRRRFSVVTVAGAIVALLFLFGVVGEWRSGNIKELAQVKEHYQWVPTAAIWFYSYSYFSVLNLDNAVTSPRTPFYDGSSFTDILPNILRPDYEHPDFLEIPIFNVATAYSPLYIDIGLVGALTSITVIMALSAAAFRNVQRRPTLGSVGIYAVLYFAAMISFFYNAWGYLPVMFQLPLFYAFERLMTRRMTHADAAVLPLSLAVTEHEPSIHPA
jgi:hypothetical protein